MRRQTYKGIILPPWHFSHRFCFSLSPFSIHFLNIYPFLFHSLFLTLFLSHTSIYLLFLILAFTLHSQFTPTTLYSIRRLLTNQTHITNTTPVRWNASICVKRFHLCETPSLHFAFSFFLSFYSTHVSTFSLPSTYLLFLSSLVALPHTVLTCSILHPHCGSTSTALHRSAFSHFIQPVSEQSVMAKKGRKQSILKSKEHDAKKEGGRH